VIVRAEGAPLGWQPVVAASVVGVVAGAVAHLAFGRALPGPGKARRGFLLLSSVLLLLSFASPIQGLEGAGFAEILLLDLMHLTTAAAAVAGAEWAARPEWRFGSAAYSPRRIEPATALVTGATSGIGAAVAQQLASRGFRVVGIGRSAEKARSLQSERLTILTGDLGSVRDAMRLAAEANELVGEPGFGVVVHCAGTLSVSSRPTSESIDSNFATSYLGRVVVTNALRRAPTWRLLNVAAAQHGSVPSAMRFELSQPADIGRGMRSHGQAQLANDLWAASLARRGVSSFGYGPGSVDTAIRRELPPTLNALMKPLFAIDTRTADEAASDIVRLVLDDALPSHGFASRWGLFSHDPFVLDPTRQDALARLTDAVVARASEAGAHT
jgi:NAD(P)-dependent dehydrogenase (short-subunit alcohol dehydrogenase family)